jgi:hypothetical protein
MAAKKTTPSTGKAVAEAFRAAAASSNDSAKWEAAKRALLDAIEKAESAAALEKLLRSASVSEAFLGEAEAWPEVAHALVLVSASLAPKEGARTLGWLARGSAFYPNAIVRPDRSATLSHSCKPQFRQALAEHQEFFAEWLVDGSAERRAAAAYAIAASGASTAVQFEELQAAIKKESNATALASALLALGVVLFRRDNPQQSAIDDARSLALEKRRDKNALVRLTAVALLALSGSPLGADDLTQVLDHVRNPVALPGEWGWHSAQPPTMKSDWLALSLLCWASVEKPEPAIALLLEQKPKTSPLGFVTLMGEALLHLVFTARGRPLPRYVFVPAEADALERQVAVLLSEEPWSRSQLAERKLGLPRGAEQVAALFAGEALEYRPLAVPSLAEPRSWHFARIWAGVVFDELSPEAGCNAVVDSCSPTEAIALIALDGHAKLPAQAQVSDVEQWQREFTLALGVCAALRQRGFDVTSALEALETDRLVNLSVLAAAYLTDFGANLASEKITLVARGLAAARSTEPLLGLLARLPDGTRRQILHSTAINARTLPFVKTCLDAPIVRGLVLFATGAWGKDHTDAVLDILQQGGGETSSLLQSIEYPNEDFRIRSQGFVQKAVERLAAERPRG